MTMLTRLRKREQQGDPLINVSFTGAGLIGRGLAHQLHVMPGMRPALIVNRTLEKAVEIFRLLGYDDADICATDDIKALRNAIESGKPAACTNVELLRELDNIDVVVEVTGAVEYGARVALAAIESGKHMVMMNAETDATIGCLLNAKAEAAGVVYTNSDGDQPGVLQRLVDYVEAIGLEVVAAVNCKGFMDVHATPDTIRPWAEKQGTSLLMTTAFTDGTKMNIENAVLSNATGLLPAKRGMHGVKSTLADALTDCMKTFQKTGVVDYTLGGDFGGGVFVIGRGDDPTFVQPYLQYLKMGAGPEYLFYRPYHLCHLETPFTVAEAALDRTPTIAPLGGPLVDVVTIAKRDLQAGETLDGIGGYLCHGEIDCIENARGLLPIGLAGGVELTKPIAADEPIPFDAVKIDDSSLLVRLWREQEAMFAATSNSATA